MSHCFAMFALLASTRVGAFSLSTKATGRLGARVSSTGGAAANEVVKFDPTKVRAISFDVTGTIMVHAEPIMKTYADAAVWARLPNPPSEAELKPAFKQAYKESLLASPCFGGREGLSSRQWWTRTVTRALELCETPRRYSRDEFDRFFRRVYQHYGSLEGYAKLEDASAFLEWCAAERADLLLGITSNTPARTMETVLPMKGYHGYFRWFTCSQDVGVEKPGREIFDAAFAQARFWYPDLERGQILHIGDSLVRAGRVRR